MFDFWLGVAGTIFFLVWLALFFAEPLIDLYYDLKTYSARRSEQAKKDILGEEAYNRAAQQRAQDARQEES